jgi:hypothetical protein
MKVASEDNNKGGKQEKASKGIWATNCEPL